MPFNPEGSLRVITDGTIKFSSPDEFNDPFDCNPIVDGDSYEEKIKTDPHLRKTLCKQTGISPGKWLAHKKKFLTRIRNGFSAGQYNELTQKRLGVCCLTSNAVNPLMWAHYADSHKGFAVEFQIPTTFTPGELAADPLFDVKLLAAQPVQYVEDRPVVSAFDEVDDRVNKGFYFKSKHWQYEDEYRVLSRDLGSGIHKYQRNRVLSAVIAGCKMDNKDLGALEQAVRELNDQENTAVDFYQAEISPQKFKLVIPNHPIWSQER